MKKSSYSITVFWLAALVAAQAQTTSFTYQGHLTADGNAVNGPYDLQFRLFATPSNNTALAGPLNLTAAPVTNGLFTALLDFGEGVFNGEPGWLEIAVKNSFNDGPFSTLSPRQAVTATPYSLHAANAAGLMSFGNEPLEIKVNGLRVLRLESTQDDSFIAGAPNVIGGAPVNLVEPGVKGGTIGGGGAVGFEDVALPNRVAGHFGTVGGGVGNLSGATLATVGGGQA